MLLRPRFAPDECCPAEHGATDQQADRARGCMVRARRRQHGMPANAEPDTVMVTSPAASAAVWVVPADGRGPSAWNSVRTLLMTATTVMQPLVAKTAL